MVWWILNSAKDLDYTSDQLWQVFAENSELGADVMYLLGQHDGELASNPSKSLHVNFIIHMPGVSLVCLTRRYVTSSTRGAISHETEICVQWAYSSRLFGAHTF